MQIPKIKYFRNKTPRTNFRYKGSDNLSFISRATFQTTTSKTVLLLSAVFFVALAALFLTWIRVSQFQNGYELARLEKKHLTLHETKQTLALELTVLKRPERIRKLARQRLRLRRPVIKQIIRF